MAKKKHSLQAIPKEVELALVQLEKEYGKNSLFRLGDNPFGTRWESQFSTGSLGLDLAIGTAWKDEKDTYRLGIPGGKTIEIFGPESSGKTTLCNHIVASAQSQGGLAAFVDVEQTWDRKYAKKVGVDTDNLIFSQPDSGEQALNTVHKLLVTGKFAVIVVDSVASLVPQSEIENGMSDNSMSVQARMMSKALRFMTPKINKTNTLVIFTNQLREKVGVFFGNPEVIELVKSGYGRETLAKHFGINISKGRRWRDLAIKELNKSTGPAMVKLAASRQKLMDSNRINNKIVRETVRTTNALGEFIKHLTSTIKTHSFCHHTTRHAKKKGRAIAVIHLSDLHFNELVDLEHNKYNFRVASARLKLFADECLSFMSAWDVNHVVIAMTGDMMNSDRRLDELLAQACNRSRATFIAVDILQQFIRHINTEHNVSVVCVTGNESRMSDEIGWMHEVASDNYDFTIFNILKLVFKDAPGVEFHDGNDPMEQKININGVNFLLMHGKGPISKDVEQSVEKVIGRYAAKNELVNYVIFGHLHSARVGDVYSRSSSLVGSNSYSEFGLNLFSKASQNLYIVTEDRRIHGVKVDLQTTDESAGYNIEKSIESYNAKSRSKLSERKVVFEVKI